MIDALKYPFELMTKAINKKHRISANHTDRAISIPDGEKLGRAFNKGLNLNIDDTISICYEGDIYTFTVK